MEIKIVLILIYRVTKKQETMKYVQLFESWLSEAEGDEITKFNKNAPRDWPVLKTEISDVYPSGKLDYEIMQTILGRADQTGKTFNKNAKIDYTIFDPITRISNDGAISMRGDVVGTDSNSLKETSIKFREAGIKNPDKGVSAMGIGEPGEKSASSYANSENACILFIPQNLKNSGTSKTSGMITNLPAVVVFKNRIYASNIGQVLCFINQGMASDAVSALTEDPKDALATIFAGEGKARLLAYEKTIAGREFLAAPRDEEDPKDSKMKPRDGVYTIGPDGTQYVGQILFEFDKADLTQEAKNLLSKSAILRKALQDAEKTIEIVGHADGKGDAAYNDKLSLERAKSVEEYLKNTNVNKWWKAVDATVTVKGMGFKQKVAEDNKGTNATAASLNRRVEFIIDGAKPNFTEIKKEIGLK